MNKDYKKYTVNNPTQINNYGSRENSAQTIWRNIQNAIKDPRSFTDSVFLIINELFSLFVKTVWLSIKLSIIPAIVIAFLGLIFISIQQSTSLTGMLERGREGFGILIFDGIIPLLGAALHSPMTIILGCFILFGIVMAEIFSRYSYPDDIEKRKVARKAMIITFMLAIIAGIAEAWGKQDKKK